MFCEYTVKIGVHGNSILRCPGHWLYYSSWGVTISPRGSVQLHPCTPFIIPNGVLWYTHVQGPSVLLHPIRAHNAPNMVLLILYQWGVVILPFIATATLQMALYKIYSSNQQMPLVWHCICVIGRINCSWMNEDAQEFFIQPGGLELFITHVSSDVQTATINNNKT